MAHTIKWLGAIGLALGLLLGNRAMAAQETAGQPAADPAVWGIYAQLVGSTRQASDGYRLHWRWSQSGKELVEEYFVPSSGKLAYTNTITPGPTPGTLHALGSALGGKKWNGTLQPDGSVVFAGTGMLKFSYMATIGSDGAYEIRGVKVRDGVVVSTKKLANSNRYLPVEDATPPVATAVEVPAVGPAVVAVATPVAVAATASAAKTASYAGFGWLETRIGHSFVGSNPEGQALTLDIYREGNAVALHLGTLGGGRGGRMLIAPGAVPGSYELLEAWDSGARTKNRYAYFVGTGHPPADDPLLGYYADPRKEGDLVIGYDIPGGYLVLTFQPDKSNGGLSFDQNGGKRTLGIRRAIGNLDYIGGSWFSPTSQEAINYVLQHQQAQRQRRAEERRADAELDAYVAAESQQRAAQWEQSRTASEQGLADSISRLNNTVASVEAQQAQYRAQQEAVRAQQEAASRAADAQRAREATERQNEIARQYEAQRQARQQAQAAALVVAAKPASSPSPAPAAAGGAQWFVFCVAIKPGAYMDAPGAMFLSSISTIARTGSYSSSGTDAESFGSRVNAQYGVSVAASCHAFLDRATAQARWQEQHDSFGMQSYKKVATGIPATP